MAQPLIGRLDHASVNPLVQVGTQIQDAVSEFAVSRPVSMTPPLREGTASGDEREFRVVCTIIAIVLESSHGSLLQRRLHPDIHDKREFVPSLGHLVC